MAVKKGVYFSIDSILAGGIILTVIVLASSFYLNEQPSLHLNYLSQDLVITLSTLTVEEIDNDYLNSLIEEGTITKLDNTVIEQIGEFWADDEMDLANMSASNVTELLVPDTMGFGIWINNETIYTRDLPIKRSLVSSKKIISGIAKGEVGGETRKNPPILWGPAVVEVRVWQ